MLRKQTRYSIFSPTKFPHDVNRSKPEIYLWMTASIIGCIGLQSVKYERLHSLLWGVFHNWTKPCSFIHLWRMSSIFGGRQQIWQQNMNVCQIWETFSGCSNVEFQSAQSLQKHCKIALYERFSLADGILIMSCDQQLIHVYSWIKMSASAL